MKIFILLTLFFFVEPTFGFGQLSNDSNAQQPAVQIDLIDTLHLVSNVSFKNYQELLNEILKKNKYISLFQKPVFLTIIKNKPVVRSFHFTL